MKKVSKKVKKNTCPHCKGKGEIKRGYFCHECYGSGKRKKMKMMVWPYSQFPYVICGIGFMQNDGTAYIPSCMQHFCPVKVLSIKDGLKLKAELAALAFQHKAALNRLHEGFVTRLRAICPVAAETH